MSNETTMTEKTKKDECLVPRDVLVSASRDFFKDQQESAQREIKRMCAKATQERLAKAIKEGKPTSVHSPITVTGIPEETFENAGGRFFIEKWLKVAGDYQLGDVRKKVTNSPSYSTVEITFH